MKEVTTYSLVKKVKCTGHKINPEEMHPFNSTIKAIVRNYDNYDNSYISVVNYYRNLSLTLPLCFTP